MEFCTNADFKRHPVSKRVRVLYPDINEDNRVGIVH